MASFREAVQVIDQVKQFHMLILFSHSGDAMTRHVALWRLHHAQQAWSSLTHLMEASRGATVKRIEGADSKLRDVARVHQEQTGRDATGHV